MLDTLFSGDVGLLPILAIAGAGLAIWFVRYLAENDPGWKGSVANILTIIGGIAVVVVIAVVSASFIAIALAVAAILFFMAPLFVLGGASGVADRRPRRGSYYRNDPYRDYYY